jgi:hypothetical protein
VGFPLRFVFAILRSSLLLIDLAIWRDAPLSDDLERLPRFAASAAPAAICCFFDFAGIHNLIRAPRLKRIATTHGAQPRQHSLQWRQSILSSRTLRRADFHAFAFKSFAQFPRKFDGARCIAVDTDRFAAHLDILAFD